VGKEREGGKRETFQEETRMTRMWKGETLKRGENL
jgi:hypothetical protein